VWLLVYVICVRRHAHGQDRLDHAAAVAAAWLANHIAGCLHPRVQAGGPGLSRAAFILGALSELSVALCRGNASLCRSGANVATHAAGLAPMPGLARPSAEVVQACFAPCLWVWGVWFGFASRCVALFCGIFVHLHLALFPAGGPFLPSLSINLYSWVLVWA
jgi:hypothetical protein